MRSTAWTKMAKTFFNLPRVSPKNKKLHQGFTRRVIKIAYAQITAYFRPECLVWSKRKVFARYEWGVVYACNFRSLHARIRHGLRGHWVSSHQTLRIPSACFTPCVKVENRCKKKAFYLTWSLLLSEELRWRLKQSFTIKVRSMLLISSSPN